MPYPAGAEEGDVRNAEWAKLSNLRLIGARYIDGLMAFGWSGPGDESSNARDDAGGSQTSRIYGLGK